MDWFDTVYSGGRVCVRLPGGLVPIRIKAQDVTTLGIGWRSRGAYAGFFPFIVVDLCRDSGEGACWILDGAGNFIGDGTGNFIGSESDGAAQRNSFVNALHKTATFVGLELSCKQSALSDLRIVEYYNLQKSTRISLLNYLPTPALIGESTTIFDLRTNERRSWSTYVTSGDVSSEVSVSHDQLMRAMHVALNDRFIDAFRTTTFTWQNLILEGPNPNSWCFFLDYNFGFIRCVDPTTSLLYYIVLWGSCLQSVAVFLPQLRALFTYTAGIPALFHNYISAQPIDLSSQLLDFLLRSDSSLLRWLAKPPRVFANFMWPVRAAHLGHYLWNETSGLETIVNELETDQLPKTYALGGVLGSDFYGAVEDLFPELVGTIVRTFHDVSALTEHCIRNNLQLFRISGHFVSKKMRVRVKHAVNADPDVALVRNLVTDWGLRKVPTIVFGLRSHNRTHADIASFYCALLDHLRTLVNDLIVIVDGVNSAPGQSRGTSYKLFDSKAHRTEPVLNEEDRMAKQIVDRANFLSLRAINCVGTTMRQNLFWIEQGHMFVAPWGGGLVKYRWICNLPGYILASRVNLLNPVQTGIYHLPTHMEDPSTVEYVDPNLVSDLHADGILLDERGRDPVFLATGLSNVSFAVDYAEVIPRIGKLFLQAIGR